MDPTNYAAVVAVHVSLQLRVLENNQISSQHSSNNEGFEMCWQLGF